MLKMEYQVMYLEDQKRFLVPTKGISLLSAHHFYAL